MNKKLTIMSVFYLPILHASADQALNQFKIDLSGTFAYSDNANKDNDQPLGELRRTYVSQLGGGYRNEWMNMHGEYSIRDVEYDKNSQPSYVGINGASFLSIGSPFQPFSLALSHSQRELLNQADATDKTSNFDQRSILTASPEFRWRPTNADLLTVTGTYTDMTFKQDKTFNGNSSGLGASWVRDISNSDQLLLNLHESTTEFVGSPQSNYRYKSALLGYSVKLRRLSYSIQYGVNAATPESQGKQILNPVYSLSANYLTALQSLSLQSRQLISNSGSGNGNSMIPVEGVFGSKSKSVDIVNLSDTSIRWGFEGVCDLCSVGLNARYATSDYTLLNEDSRDVSFGGHFSYQITKKIKLKISDTRNERHFLNALALKDYVERRKKISLSYNSISSIGVEAFVQNIKRESGTLGSNNLGSNSFDEGLAGLSVHYTF